MFFQQVFSKLHGAFILSALPITIITGLPTAAFSASLSSQSYDEIYVFGDSLSDVGNTSNVFETLTGEAFPPPPYFQGRASNGPVWVEYLGQELGLTPTLYIDVATGAIPADGINFAFGGANTESSNTIEPSLLPGLQQQIDNFTANTSADPDALYIVWAGANDYLSAGVTDPTEPVNNLSTAVSSLAEYGAEDIMVVNLPDLGKLPGTSDNSQNSTNLNALTEAHNSSLAANLDSLSQNSDVNIIPLDVNSLFNEAIADPGAFGLKNVTDSCLAVTCDNPDEYLFWDDIHPTTTAHQLVGELAVSALKSESVPEPSGELGILALGALGAVSVFKRKQKKASMR